MPCEVARGPSNPVGLTCRTASHFSPQGTRRHLLSFQIEVSLVWDPRRSPEGKRGPQLSPDRFLTYTMERNFRTCS